MSWVESVREEYCSEGAFDMPMLDDFWIYCGNVDTAFPEWRKGQALFNALHRVRPDLAAKIHNTDLDPYYDDSRRGALCDWISTNWVERLPVNITSRQRIQLVDALWTADRNERFDGTSFELYDLVDALWALTFKED
jgi:hypothetical protein